MTNTENGWGEMVTRVSQAIAEASEELPFCLYDYSQYADVAYPHVVLDNKTGEEVFRSADRLEANDEYTRLTHNYVANAALQAAGVKELAEEHGQYRTTLTYIATQAQSALDGKQDRGGALKVIQMNARDAVSGATLEAEKHRAVFDAALSDKGDR